MGEDRRKGRRRNEGSIRAATAPAGAGRNRAAKATGSKGTRRSTVRRMSTLRGARTLGSSWSARTCASVPRPLVAASARRSRQAGKAGAQKGSASGGGESARLLGARIRARRRRPLRRQQGRATLPAAGRTLSGGKTGTVGTGATRTKGTAGRGVEAPPAAGLARRARGRARLARAANAMGGAIDSDGATSATDSGDGTGRADRAAPQGAAGRGRLLPLPQRKRRRRQELQRRLPCRQPPARRKLPAPSSYRGALPRSRCVPARPASASSNTPWPKE